MDLSPIRPSRGKARGRPSLSILASDTSQGTRGIRPMYPTPVQQQPVHLGATGIQRPPRAQIPIPVVPTYRKNDGDLTISSAKPSVSNT